MYKYTDNHIALKKEVREILDKLFAISPYSRKELIYKMGVNATTLYDVLKEKPRRHHRMDTLNRIKMNANLLLRDLEASN